MASNKINDEYVQKGYLKAYLANRGIKCASYEEWEHLCECIDEAKCADTKQAEWISCFERKPEIPGFYLVTKQLKTGNRQVAIGMYSPMLNAWSGNGNFDNVVAWMPLPEPYGGESE